MICQWFEYDFWIFGIHRIMPNLLNHVIVFSNIGIVIEEGGDGDLSVDIYKFEETLLQ